MAVDGQHIYWTNDAGNTIGRANLDGSSPNQSFITGANAPHGVAVDGQYIYWTNGAGNTIGEANLDGSSPNQSFISGANNPHGVAVDGLHIYWTNESGNTIGEANLDGSSPNQSLISGANAPHGVAVLAVPGAPTGVSATAGDGQATVSFAAPSSNGSAITGYTVSASPGGATSTGSASPITVNGLTNGTAYTFTVTATNGVGTGTASAASSIVTPAAAVAASPSPTPAPAPAPDTQAPSAPAGLAGSFSSGLLVLSWQASSDNVGVDHYELYLNNTPLMRIGASQTQASIRTFEPTGQSVYTVRAFDAAGSQSAVLTSVTVTRAKRPTAVPKRIPQWAWQLLAWQAGGEHGTRPKTPAALPHSYASWKAWRLKPFQLTT